jgi:hypothetical protein
MSTDSNDTLAVDVAESTGLLQEAKPEQPAAPVLSNKQKKSIANQEVQMKRMMTRVRTQQGRQRRKLKVAVANIKKALGKEDFALLKEICTRQIPEQKGPDGAIIQKAKSVVNYHALVSEGRQALVLNRQARIESGTRKKMTGRSSQRKTHKNSVNYINMRSLNTAANEAIR